MTVTNTMKPSSKPAYHFRPPRPTEMSYWAVAGKLEGQPAGILEHCSDMQDAIKHANLIMASNLPWMYIKIISKRSLTWA
jgi:hypothetical protein